MVVIDRCIPDKCYFIEVSELAEYILPDTLGADGLLVLCPLILEGIDRVLQFVRIKRSLHKSLEHRVHDLGTIVWLELAR